jgi:sulfatase maturation enzyme AslB (radical SAM superfamily)
LIAVLYAKQEYYSDLYVDGKYRQVASLTLSVGCPINCKYCAQKQFLKAYYKSTNPVKMLTYNNFIKIIERIPKDVIISFTGFVEPFANPDCLKMVMRALETHKIRLYSTIYNVTIDDYEKFCDHHNLITFDIHIPDNQYNTVFPITDNYKNLLRYIMQKIPKYATFIVCCLGIDGGPRAEVAAIVQDYVRVGSGTAIDSLHGLVYQNYVYHGNAELQCLSDCGRIQEPQAGVGVILPNGDVFACSKDYELTSIIGNIFDDTWESLMKSEKRQKFIN